MLKPIVAFAALLTAGALVAPTVSQAADNDTDTQSAIVSYADLNLAHNAGRTVLERRIAGAAGSVCDVGDSRNVAALSEAQRCRVAAIDGARPQFEAAVAAALHPTVTVADSAAMVVTGR